MKPSEKENIVVDYKSMIIDTIKRIENPSILKYIYSVISTYLQSRSL